MHSAWQLFKRVVDHIENINISIYHFLSFLFIILLRVFLESFADTDNLFSREMHLHFVMFFPAIALSFIFLIRIITRESFKKIINIALHSFGLILLPPLIDLVVSRGAGLNMDYLIPGVDTNLIYRYFFPVGKFFENGITPGLKVEAGIFLLLIFFYFILKTKSVLRSMMGLFFAYNIFFLFAATPFIVLPYCRIYDCFVVMTNVLINYFSVFSILLLVILFFLFEKEKFKIIIGDSRFSRQVHYFLMFFFGIIIGAMQIGVNDALAVLRPDMIFVSAMGIIFGLLFSGITNDIIDYNIDKISNTDRPLVQGKISLDFYKKLAWVALALSLFFASLNGYKSLFYQVLFIGNYFLYSMPPLRLKRVFFFSKLLISLNSLVLIFMGYSYFLPDLKTFPRLIILIFLIGFTAAIQFIDIKDYEGDKKEGIITLPVFFGLKNSKIIIGLFFLINYLLFNFVVNNIYFLVLSILAGLWQFYLVNKKVYKEKQIFVLYLSSWLAFIFSYIFSS
ncbi:UbiA family prenyltransferase [Candidatus Parcubacteria bacterium]|nr:UbiA family prenyltransferase [Patescibacteria group bacterium]MBU4309587.1 UbiA family prenyltransferase [Patescibacteria group bacterium]MBU4578025.1 UbiA family prenyltransferase [Patescibacteria group bacterium]MCG2696467.1 UbiA family prenyltransferase [Candidatus Parcubacteria bacterium]